MRWEGNEQSDNVEDRRGSGGGGFGGLPIGGRSVGLGTVAVAVIAGWIFGINPAHAPRIDERRRAGAAGAAAAGPGAQAARQRPRSGFRLDRAAQHRGGLGRHLSPERPHLHADPTGPLPRRDRYGLRHGPVGHGAVLLPGRPEGLHRPRLLRHAAKPTRRARRVRAGLCHRARSRPPRPGRAGHHGQGRPGAQPDEPCGGQRDQRARRTAGRLLRRRLGAPLAGVQAVARSGRHRGGA